MVREELVVLDALQEDTVLSRDVLDGSGNILLPAGSRLTRPMHVRLRQHGVGQVWRVVAMSEQERERCLQAAEATLRERFAATLEEPLMRSLFDTLLDYRRESCGEP